MADNRDGTADAVLKAASLGSCTKFGTPAAIQTSPGLLNVACSAAAGCQNGRKTKNRLPEDEQRHGKRNPHDQPGCAARKTGFLYSLVKCRNRLALRIECGAFIPSSRGPRDGQLV
jgi:hypothetical protein